MELENISNMTQAQKDKHMFSFQCRSNTLTGKCAYQEGENVGEDRETRRGSWPILKKAFCEKEQGRQ